MARRISYRTEIIMTCLGSLIAGYLMSRQDDGGERLKKNVLSSVVGTVGMPIGYYLGQRRTDSRDV